MQSLTCFKAYDVRGKVPSELNAEIAENIARAFACVTNAKHIVIGHDIRLTGPELTQAVVAGLTKQGCDVTFIGQCGTEEIYFAAQHLDVDGGICITASHNPEDYNGMKFVERDAKPLSISALKAVKALAETAHFDDVVTQGCYHTANLRSEYKAHLLSYIDKTQLKPLKLVVNAGNGGAGAIVDLLENELPFEFIKVNHEANGHFPNGVPNPLLEQNRQSTADAVIEHGADLGIAWDGDFDRCFFFDENGQFIEGYYIVGLLASAMLAKHAGGGIVYDPRLCWNTQQIIKQQGGEGTMSKTGHAFIKQTMREVDAVYGGEMSAHHYFKAFAYCDNGTIPWLLLTETLSTQNAKLSQLVSEQQASFPCSGEINFTVADSQALLTHLLAIYAGQAISVDQLDGLSLTFDNWRFNIRASNTEPLIRLNIETRADTELLAQKVAQMSELIQRFQ
ncbi:phosphomannomutase [Catenovulum sp. 2E275]|uniref:phosphomannomutase n=1 Tax=Catenovulum sp. 2E275 TaxID=2980497 RepID=UPI0021D260CB|nr:phosphomannomutase [Catenovulum sp. 2E275]MCU4674093.1 phosphomannomutase [Catenovulum sp. 2E275]